MNRYDVVENGPVVAAQALADGEALWTYPNEDQTAVLGLREQTGGWGLLVFKSPDGTRVTGACDRILVAALEERQGDLPGWDSGIRFWAWGWPGDGPLIWASSGQD